MTSLSHDPLCSVLTLESFFFFSKSTGGYMLKSFKSV